jgi:hypothetical protein
MAAENLFKLKVYCSSKSCHFCVEGIELKNTVPITYIESDGTEKTVEAEIGKNLMDIAHEHNIDLEGELEKTPRLLKISKYYSIDSSKLLKE